MKRSRFSEEQIIAILKEQVLDVEQRPRIPDMQHGRTTDDLWRSFEIPDDVGI